MGLNKARGQKVELFRTEWEIVLHPTKECREYVGYRISAKSTFLKLKSDLGTFHIQTLNQKLSLQFIVLVIVYNRSTVTYRVLH